MAAVTGHLPLPRAAEPLLAWQVREDVLHRTMQRETRPAESGRLPNRGEDLSGDAVLRRVRRWRFPVHELVSNGEVMARFGRFGLWPIFFGGGVPIELVSGTRWRLRSLGMAGAICPVIVDSDIRKVAMAAPHFGGYGLNGPNWAYVMYPSEPRRLVRSNHWILRDHEENVGVITRTPWRIETDTPVPLGAVIIGLALAVYAIPGESKLEVPAFRWGVIR
jgi:hypothetical protein